MSDNRASEGAADQLKKSGSGKKKSMEDILATLKNKLKPQKNSAALRVQGGTGKEPVSDEKWEIARLISIDDPVVGIQEIVENRFKKGHLKNRINGGLKAASKPLNFDLKDWENISRYNS